MSDHPVRNRLLASLPPEVLSALLPKLTHVRLPMKQTLYASGDLIEGVYFPEVGMISMISELDEGTLAEVGVIGREGMLGTPLLSGVDTSFVEAQVQVPGSAWSMGAGAFRRELADNVHLRVAVLRYNEAQQNQIMQTAACNGRHGLEERLARWLLMAHDRVDGDDLPLTQEFMAMMLGVHRPSITVTAGILARAGLIRYGRGLVTILDRPGLEAASCECHAALRRRLQGILGTSTG